MRNKLFAALAGGLLVLAGASVPAQAAPSPSATIVNATVSTHKVTSGTKAAAKVANLPKGAKVVSTTWSFGNKKYSTAAKPILKKTGTLKVKVRYQVGSSPSRVVLATKTVKAGPGKSKYSTCAKLKAAKYGPYYKGTAPFGNYRDSDKDGVVCE